MKNITKKQLNKEEYTSLADLFCDWKKAHKEDVCEELIEKTFPTGKDASFRNSFCVDGKFDDNASDIKILFVCRESNVDKPEETDNFWMKNVVNEKVKDRKLYFGSGLNPKDKKAQTAYYNCMLAIASGTTAQEDQDASCLKNCAYMNINKRGGSNKCNMTRLRNYSVAYQDYISKEIRLLNPENIIILGKLPDETEKIILAVKRPTYVYPKHPCVYSKDLMDKFISDRQTYKRG